MVLMGYGYYYDGRLGNGTWSSEDTFEEVAYDVIAVSAGDEMSFISNLTGRSGQRAATITGSLESMNQMSRMNGLMSWTMSVQ